MELAKRFAFYRERNAAPLAYYFARVHHVATFCDRNSRPQKYIVPTFLVLWNIDGQDHGKGGAV